MQLSSLLAAGAALAVLAVAADAQAGQTFDAVKQKGFVQCGVSTGLAGFSSPTDKGKWTGLDVDVCRAIAAAMFGDAEKVKYVPLTAQQRFTALQSGEVDILSRNTTWTLTARHRARPRFRRRQLLRRPGLHGAEEARREERQGAERRHGLRRSPAPPPSSTSPTTSAPTR